MTELRIDPAASRLAIRTRATGMLARLAHDLEISAAEVRGHARLDGDGAGWTAELLVPVSGLSVAGVLHGDRLDPAGLSASDRGDVERKMRDEVLRGTREVRVEASGRSRAHAEARVHLHSGAASISSALTTREAPGGALTVAGTAHLSLRALGIPEIKGPLGAFKLKDDLEIRFELTLRPAPSEPAPAA